jgi:cytochrome c-type protein NapB
MTPAGARGPSPAARLLAILAAVVLMIAGMSLGSSLPRAPSPRVAPPAPGWEDDWPISAEVEELRVGLRGPVLEGARPRPEAQPRTLALARSLRAYPGAPPQIPHGLTDEEFRLTRCNACHERGGFVPRFGAYAPVTPHPEYADCLQCHASSAMRVGVPLPDRPFGLPCTQCHVDPDRPPPTLVALDWRTTAWPALGQRGLPGGPPWIPHDLELRGNCTACHVGPGAVHEIRTSHPERVYCRQCHLRLAPDAGDFVRLLDRGAHGSDQGSLP